MLSCRGEAVVAWGETAAVVALRRLRARRDRLLSARDWWGRPGGAVAMVHEMGKYLLGRMATGSAGVGKEVAPPSVWLSPARQRDRGADAQGEGLPPVRVRPLSQWFHSHCHAVTIASDVP